MKKLLPFFAFCLVWPFFAAAQTTSVTPVHGWLLGPSTLTGANSQSCILFNQFSDGSGLRFNINNEKVETITIIYRDDIFDPTLSTNYKTILETSNAFRVVLDGYAYGQNTLTITPPAAGEFFDELKRNSRLTIAVAKDQKTFNLRNLAQNLELTRNCAFSEPEPQVVLDPTKEIHIFADLRQPRRGNINNDDVWRAERGERVSNVMQRWSTQAGKDLSWRDNSDPIVTKEFVYEGRQEDALEKFFDLIE